MFENPRRGRQARNFTTNVPKILDVKSPSEQIFFRKLSLSAPKTSLGWPNLNMKRKIIWILVELKLCHRANGLLIAKILYIRFGPLEIVKSRGVSALHVNQCFLG